MKTADQRPSSRRGPSGAWSRLKPAIIDPLENYGLPSKGETRLNNFKAQESYYNTIVERYMKFCASTSGGDELDALFASLSLEFNLSTPSKPPACAQASKSLSNTSSTKFTPQQASNELSMILSALRKLREAITATSRRDHFAQRAYIFNVHSALLCRDWESYSPALYTLLNTIHPVTPLPSSEHHEFVGYLILDLACRQGNLADAYRVKSLNDYKNRRVELVLNSLVQDNWMLFWKMRRAVDGYQRRILEFAENGMRMHALKCLGKSYMTADRPFVERCADRKWVDLVKDGVGWELADGEKIVIRRPKAK